MGPESFIKNGDETSHLGASWTNVAMSPGSGSGSEQCGARSQALARAEVSRWQGEHARAG